MAGAAALASPTRGARGRRASASVASSVAQPTVWRRATCHDDATTAQPLPFMGRVLDLPGSGLCPQTSTEH
eukprot:5313858-Prymnesium_polylepis.1